MPEDCVLIRLPPRNVTRRTVVVFGSVEMSCPVTRSDSIRCLVDLPRVASRRTHVEDLCEHIPRYKPFILMFFVNSQYLACTSDRRKARGHPGLRAR